jgi:hypothetical protein
VSETGRCPYCGSLPGPVGADRAPVPDAPAEAGIGPLYREVRRIREIAETRAAEDARSIPETRADNDARSIPETRAEDDARSIPEAPAADDDARRIAELTRQVQELRATVARLRGPGVGARPVLARADTAPSGTVPR